MVSARMARKSQCPLWVNFGLSRPTAATSAPEGEADEIRAKADVPVGMSAVGGGADIVCQGLSGPFLARRRHCQVDLYGRPDHG